MGGNSGDPTGLYVTRKTESRSTVLDIRHVRIDRFSEESPEESVAFETIKTHLPGDVIHLNAIGFFDLPGESPLDWDSSFSLQQRAMMWARQESPVRSAEPFPRSPCLIKQPQR